MNIALIVLLLCICLSVLIAIAFVLGVIPNTEPQFRKTYDIEGMKSSIKKIDDYSKSSKVKPIGYKYECENIKDQLNKITDEKAMKKSVYGIDGSKTGKQKHELEFGKVSLNNAFEKCDQFL